MNYIIDAYNLIGKLSNIALSDPNKEEKLIQRLLELNVSKQDYFIIVFDGKNKNTPFQSNQQVSQIHIIYTDILESADDYILRLIETLSNKESYTVISSDNEIKYKCKKIKLKAINSESFFRHLAKQKKESILDEKPLKQFEVEFWLKQFNKKKK